MSNEECYAQFRAERAEPPPLTSGDTLHWDGWHAASRSVECMHVSEPLGCAAWLEPPPAPGPRASAAVTIQPACLLPPSLAPTIDWATEAARLTLYLDPALLAPLHGRLSRASGTLMWAHGQGDGACGPQVGCADQSHFTALFRRHVAMTPNTYRNTTKRV